MYKLVELESPIPSQLYVAMAEVLAYVYRLKNQNLRPVAAQA
jgi:flagellar biosynthesis protein FlhB